MKNYSKKFALLLLSGLALGAVTGCNKDSGDVTVQFWTKYYDYSEQYGSNADRDFLEACKAEFEAANKGIKINISYKGSYGNVETDLKANWGKSTMPTMALGYADWAFVGDKASSVRDMKTVAAALLAEDNDYLSNVFALEASNYPNGKLLSLPYLKTSEMFTYNKGLFTELELDAPATFTDVMNLAQSIKQAKSDVYTGVKDANNKFPAVPFIYESADNLVLTYFEEMGVPYVNPNGATIADQILFNNEKAKEFFTNAKKFNNAGLFAIGDQLTQGDYPADYLKAGKTAMIISSTTGANYFADGEDGILADIVATPSIDGTKAHKVMSQGGSVIFMKKGQKEMDAAVAFYRHITSKANMAKRCSFDASAPFRTSTATTDPYKSVIAKADAPITAASSYADKKDAYVAKALKVNALNGTSGYLFTSPVFDKSAEARTAIKNCLITILNADATTDEQIANVVNTALTNAYTEVTK